MSLRILEIAETVRAISRLDVLEDRMVRAVNQLREFEAARVWYVWWVWAGQEAGLDGEEVSAEVIVRVGKRFGLTKRQVRKLPLNVR